MCIKCVNQPGKHQPEVGRFSPFRITVRRPQEFIFVTTFTGNIEFASWVDEDDIDIRDLLSK